MKRIAIVTGATGGIGGEFVRQLAGIGLDEIWAVGRNEQKLSAFSGNVVPVKADIALSEGLSIIRSRLEAEKPDVKMLVNNAGVAYMGRFGDMTEEMVASMIDINCKACALLTRIALPYMGEGAVVYNVSSASSFQPNPYLANVELEPKKIKSIAVCPGWVDTDMLPKEMHGKPIHYPGMVTVEKVVTQALKDAKRGRDVSISSLYNRLLMLYVKYLPTRFVMKLWAKSVKGFI